MIPTLQVRLGAVKNIPQGHISRKRQSQVSKIFASQSQSFLCSLCFLKGKWKICFNISSVRRLKPTEVNLKSSDVVVPNIVARDLRYTKEGENVQLRIS